MFLLERLKRAFLPSPNAIHVRQLYLAAVAHARQPHYYTEFGVADTLDGRFDSIVLQLALTLEQQRMQLTEEALAALQLRMVEQMITDLDHNLREMGVGDMSIGRKVETMAFAINGRLKAYAQSWHDDAALQEALLRNLYRGDAEATSYAAKMVSHLRETSDIVSSVAPAA
jgi:cytochrome b pre-mRNA-processing protein 3